MIEEARPSIPMANGHPAPAKGGNWGRGRGWAVDGAPRPLAHGIRSSPWRLQQTLGEGPDSGRSLPSLLLRLGGHFNAMRSAGSAAEDVKWHRRELSAPWIHREHKGLAPLSRCGAGLQALMDGVRPQGRCGDTDRGLHADRPV